jgi:hypothetical protein
MKLLSSFALSLLALSACTSDDFGDRASEVEGIYRVDSHLLNEAACSPGGTAFTDDDAFAFAKRASVLGHDFLQIYSCASLADCRAKAAQAQFQGALSFSFTLTAVDGDALTGSEVTTGFTSSNGTCTMPELSDLSLDFDGSVLRIEKSTRIGQDYPGQGGYCTTDKGRASAEKASCSEMETLSATLVEPL